MPPFAPSFRMDHDLCTALCAVPLYFAPAFAHPPFLSFFNVNLERGVIENRRGVIENRRRTPLAHPSRLRRDDGLFDWRCKFPDFHWDYEKRIFTINYCLSFEPHGFRAQSAATQIMSSAFVDLKKSQWSRGLHVTLNSQSRVRHLIKTALEFAFR